MAKTFDNINTTNKVSNKRNPLLGKPDEEVVSKSMRIYESSYKKLREMSFKEDVSMVELVKEAVEKLYTERGYDK